MLDSKHISSRRVEGRCRLTTRVGSLWALFLLAAAGGCSPQTLLLVDSCPDGGTSCSPDGGGGATALTNGLVGHWRLDDGAGSTMALDSSGNSYHATLVSLDPSTAWTTQGRLAGALETKGVGYASVPNLARIDAIETQVSLSAWIYLDDPASISDYATAASRQIRNTLQQHYHLGLNQQARPSFFANPQTPVDAIAQPVGPTPVTAKQWTHLAGTYDGTVARLFLNGTMVASGTVSGTFAKDTTPFLLGANGNGSSVSERFPGRIDEILLYNRALSPSEVARLATAISF